MSFEKNLLDDYNTIISKFHSIIAACSKDQTINDLRYNQILFEQAALAIPLDMRFKSGTRQQMEQAIEKAVRLTTEKLKEEEDPALFRGRFIGIFEAVLGMKLYQRFWPFDLDTLFADFREKITIEEGQDEDNLLEEFLKHLLKDVKKNIELEFNKLKDMVDCETLDPIKEKVNQLLKNLEEDLNSTRDWDNWKVINFSRDWSTWSEIVLNFQVQVRQLMIPKAVNKSNIEGNFKPFWANLIIMLTIVGTLPAIASMFAKLFTGQYLFCDEMVQLKSKEVTQVEKKEVFKNALVEKNKNYSLAFFSKAPNEPKNNAEKQINDQQTIDLTSNADRSF